MSAYSSSLRSQSPGPVIAFVFALLFLVYPFVLFTISQAMERDGNMPRVPAFMLALLGAPGVWWLSRRM